MPKQVCEKGRNDANFFLFVEGMMAAVKHLLQEAFSRTSLHLGRIAPTLINLTVC
jgi:hypothetical protein